MVSALNIISSDRSLQEHWVKRLVAIIIDAIIIYIIGSVIVLFLPGGWNVPFQWSLLWPTVSGVLMFLYSMLMESSSGGATLGKRVLGLRVMAIRENMNFGKAAMRNISKIHGLFLILDWAVGFVTDGDPKQKWLDRFVGTTIVVTSTLSDEEQHTYQTQQSKYAPPPQETYSPTRHEEVYQYPPKPPASAPAKQDSAQQDTETPEKGMLCSACGGRMTETGTGRLKCIRCGKIQ